MADTSDRLVKRNQVRTLRMFSKALASKNDTYLMRMRAELAQVVNTKGISSMAYDNYLMSIKAFLEA